MMTKHHCPKCCEDYDLEWENKEELNLPVNLLWWGYTVVCPLCIEGIPKEERDVNPM